MQKEEKPREVKWLIQIIRAASIQADTRTLVFEANSPPQGPPWASSANQITSSCPASLTRLKAPAESCPSFVSLTGVSWRPISSLPPRQSVTAYCDLSPRWRERNKSNYFSFIFSSFSVLPCDPSDIVRSKPPSLWQLEVLTFLLWLLLWSCLPL